MIPTPIEPFNRIHHIGDVFRTRFGVASRYYHSVMCRVEDNIMARPVFEVHCPLLTAVQDEIEALDFNPRYAREYRAAETTYWGPVVSILEQRARNAAHGRSLLDVGPGYGTLLVLCAKLGWRPFALDMSSSYLSPFLVKKYGIDFRVLSIEADSIPWSLHFDVVIMTEVLEHFNFNPIPTLRKVAASLSDDGLMIISTPDKYAGWGEGRFARPYWELPAYRQDATAIDDHIKIYHADELRMLLKQAGLHAEVTRWRRKGWRRGHLVALATKRSAPGTLEVGKLGV